MKIAVVGVGGVGGYIAAKLIQSGADVTLIAPEHHVEAIAKNNLQIIEDDRSWSVAATIERTPSKDAHFDVVFLCVKSYHIESAIKNIATALTKESLIIPLSNGVEHRDNIEKLTDATVADGAVYILAHLQDAGVIRKKGKVFALVLSKEAQKVTPLLEKAQLRYKIYEDAKEAIWKKYIFISAFATLTSYYDESIKSVYANHTHEAKETLEEIANVAAALNINIQDEVNKSLQTASKLPQDASTSMHLDISKNRPCEIETLTHYILKKAKENNLKTPLMQTMYNSLKN